MIKFFKLCFVLAAFMMIAISCNEDPTSIGSNLIPSKDNINFKLLDSYESNLIQRSSFFSEKLKLGNSDKVLLGKNTYAEASALFRYVIYLADTLLTKIVNREVILEKAWMRLVPSYSLGDKTANFDFTVHQIRSNWGMSGFDRDSIPNLQYDAANVSSNITKTDTLIQLNLNPSVLTEWLKYKLDSVNTPKNYGILLRPTASTRKLLGFNSTVSTEDLSQTVLYFVLTRPTRKDTLAVSPFLNNFAYTSTTPTQSGNLFLEGSYSRRGQLYFDISTMPKNVIINKATLELTVDTLNTFDGSNPSDSVFAQMLADSVTRKLTRDSTVATVLSRKGKIFSGDITWIVQKWGNGVDNQGLLFSLWDEYFSAARIAIYSSKNSDKALRPKLKIIYMQKQ